MWVFNEIAGKQKGYFPKDQVEFRHAEVSQRRIGLPVRFHHQLSAIKLFIGGQVITVVKKPVLEEIPPGIIGRSFSDFPGEVGPVHRITGGFLFCQKLPDSLFPDKIRATAVLSRYSMDDPGLTPFHHDHPYMGIGTLATGDQNRVTFGGTPPSEEQIPIVE